MASVPARLWRAALDMSLRKKVAVVFIGMLLVAGLNLSILHHMLQNFNGVAATATVAGKMRMLGQKLAYEALSVSNGLSDAYELLEHDIIDFEAAYLVLRSGGTAFDEQIRPLGVAHTDSLNAVWMAWRQYRDHLRQVVAVVQGQESLGMTELQHGLAVVSAELLSTTDELIRHLVHEAQETQETALTGMYWLLAVNAVILLVAYVALNGQVVEPVQRLAAYCRQLAKGNYNERIAHGHADEIGQLAQALDHSAQQINGLLHAIEQERTQLRRAALVYANTSEAVVVTDPHGFILDTNPAFSAITGYSAQEARGRSMNILASGQHDDAFYQAMWQSLHQTGKWSGDIRNKRKDGEEYVERLTIDTSYNEDGSVNCHIGLFSDVTAERHKEETIWRQAHFDHLTGLPNRQMFHEVLQRSMEEADRNGRSLALIYMDLDYFKEVNDSLGHDLGDELLKEVAQRLSRAVRQHDLVARLGGDEFTLILSHSDKLDHIEEVCRRVLKAVADSYVLRHNVVTISASLGVTLYPRDGSTATELLQNADLAMYSAKDAGRNQYRHFCPSMQQEAQERRDLLRELQHALQRNEFELYYQPIVNLRTGRIGKAEALLRWNHPQRGLVGPTDFIPLAEDSGLIVPIGDWAFRRAAAQLAYWRAALEPDFQVSVNVSPAQFMDEELDPAAWLACVHSHGMPASSVLMEITERVLLKADGAAKNKLLAFRDAGVHLALDDFGTGYSSLAYLKRFDIDFIKIDRLFVHNITVDQDALALCQAMIAMAHQLGLKVVAEGVATQDQHELLVAAGCDFAQGFLYARPLPVKEFERLVADNAPQELAVAVT